MNKTLSNTFLIFLVMCLVLSCTKHKDAELGFNHLSTEKSPYLKQHASNPVWWYTWGSEALTIAKKQNKLIFLSIGYSTCHWCHVMEKESFQNIEVAKTLNESFISIKVDREERPDVDAIYMDVIQAMTGSGGWPLNIILTPDRIPIFGGTYFSKDKLMYALNEINKSWKINPNQFITNSNKIINFLNQNLNDHLTSSFSDEIFNTYVQNYSSIFDQKYGDLQGRPKFIHSYDLKLLLRIFRRSKNKELLKMIQHSLDSISKGGIYDQLGGGFHRYSTDEKWLVPHFEKMLYDQYALADAFLEAYQATQNNEYKIITKEILDYVLRELTSPEGAFYSAEDADSDGGEGKFYLWNYDEIKNSLTREEMNEFTRVFDISKNGNFDLSSNILSIKKKYDHVHQTKILANAKSKLLAIRSKRIRPSLDTKVLTSWNGLMISVLSKAGRIFNESKYIQAAETATIFCLTKLKDHSGKLLHRYADGEAKISPTLDDYSFLIFGLIELYQSTFKEKYILEAYQMQKIQNSLFEDRTQNGYFFTTGDDQMLIQRRKEYFDNVLPSGNSISTINLLKLGLYFVDLEFNQKAKKTIMSYPTDILNNPLGYSQLIIALDYLSDSSKELAIIVDDLAFKSNNFFEKLYSDFNPNLIIGFKYSNSKSELPFLNAKKLKNETTTFYVCLNNSCQLPTNDPINVLNQIKNYNVIKR